METLNSYNNNLPHGNLDLDFQGKILINDLQKIRVKNKSIVSNNYLSLIILPTENCNFRCNYCYEDFSVGRMKNKVINGVKALLAKRCSELNYVSIEWFGGEPLMAKDVVIDISRFMLSMTYLYPQLRYHSSMTTNAYLLDYKTAQSLSDYGVREYQISLDGPQEIHDQSRVRADGASTFNKIWSNLLAIRNSSLPIKISLRIHVSVDNSNLLEPLIKDIKHEFLHDTRFSVFFKAIERLGGFNDSNIKQFSESEHTSVMSLLERKMFGDNYHSSENTDLPNNYICYASRPNSLIIRANGDIGKCTVALYDERNKIATLEPDGTIKVISGRLAPWVRGLETLDPTTLACPLINLPIE